MQSERPVHIPIFISTEESEVFDDIKDKLKAKYGRFINKSEAISELVQEGEFLQIAIINLRNFISMLK